MTPLNESNGAHLRFSDSFIYFAFKTAFVVMLLNGQIARLIRTFVEYLRVDSKHARIDIDTLRSFRFSFKPY